MEVYRRSDDPLRQLNEDVEASAASSLGRRLEGLEASSASSLGQRLEGLEASAASSLVRRLEGLEASSASSLGQRLEGLEASAASSLVRRLNEGLDTISLQAELAAFRPRIKELAEMAAHAKPAWSELLTNSSAGYAFAALATLHEALERSPFTVETIAALRSQLGDWRDFGLSTEVFDQEKRQEAYLRAGLDHRLIDLEPETFEAILEATQLRPPTPPPLLQRFVSADLEPVETLAVEPNRPIEGEKPREAAAQPAKVEETKEEAAQSTKAEEAREDAAQQGTVEESEDSIIRAGKDYQHLYRFESQFRGFVSRVLEAEAGSKWTKQRVPADCHNRWRERQAEDREARNQRHELLSYSDLGDWSQIIRRADNWPLFQPYFKRKVFVEESFTRLIPLRNDIAHMRPLTKADRLVFYAEIQQLSMAIRGPQAHDEDGDFEEDALFQ